MKDFQLINTEGMIELENHNIITPNEIIDIGKSKSMERLHQ